MLLLMLLMYNAHRLTNVSAHSLARYYLLFATSLSFCPLIRAQVEQERLSEAATVGL